MCDSRRPAEGADSASVPKGNRPAEDDPQVMRTRLLSQLPSDYRPMLDAALRAERLAVVERVRAEAVWPAEKAAAEWVARIVAGLTEERT